MGAARHSHKRITHFDTRDDHQNKAHSKKNRGGIAFDIIHSRDEADALIIKDIAQAEQNNEWTSYFVESMVQYLLWQKAPSGKISDADMAWLIGRILDKASPSMPALLCALLREMNAPPTHLFSLAIRSLGGQQHIPPQFSATHPIFTMRRAPSSYTA